MSSQVITTLETGKHAQRLTELASSVRTKLKEAGFRIVQIGLDLSEAKKLLGPGKPFELWCVGSCGLSVATAYKWIQAAEGFKMLRLHERPDLLEPSDVADLIAVSFPQGLRARILRKVEALDKAEGEAKEARKVVDLESRKLAKAEAELQEAEADAKEAKAKYDKATAKAEADAKPSMVEAEEVKSKVRDIRQRLADAKSKVASILDEAKVKVQEAHTQAQAARVAVTQAQAVEVRAEAKVNDAKANVKTEAKATKEAKPDAKAQAWEVFLKQWVNTLEAKVKETFPPEKQAVAFQLVANMVLSMAQQYRAKAA
jgi:hypothetical protein